MKLPSLDHAELHAAAEAARRGGEIVLRYFQQGVEIRGKQSYNLVSDADLESEQAIVACLRERFPGHAVLGEESHTADAGAEHLWIVDPLDGTNNFAHGLEHFAVSVAYYRGGRAECGVVLRPVSDDWFAAVRGGGAFRNGQAVQAAPSESLTEVLIGTGFFYDRGAMMEATLAAIGDLFREQIHGIRRFGTASLDLCLVGCGSFGGFFEYELAEWDFAAGALFVEEAGGRVTDCGGGRLPIAKTSILASNGRLHQRLLEVVGRHAPGSR